MAGGVVTPEAVRLEFETAGLGSRALAFFIDAFVRWVGLIVLLIATLLLAAEGVGLPPWVGIALTLTLTLVWFFGYPIAFETLWRGRTPGKAAVGLRVITREGAPPRFRHATIRALLELVDFWTVFGAPAVLSALLTRDHQRLGDLVAGTLVLRERTGAGRPAPVRFEVPPGAESYAATIAPSGVGGEEYAAVRSFLLRARELDAAVRDDIAHRLAAPLAARIGHRIPHGVHPQVFLLCLAARFQQRAGPGGPGEAVEARQRPPESGFAPPG
jgi:uncharacterized RDD family membrane protein YckC